MEIQSNYLDTSTLKGLPIEMQNKHLDTSNIFGVGTCVGIEDPDEPAYHYSVPNAAFLNQKAYKVHLSAAARSIRTYPLWRNDLSATTTQEVTDVENSYHIAKSLHWQRLVNEGKIEIGLPLDPTKIDNDEEIKSLFYQLLSQTKTGEAVLAKNNIHFDPTTDKWINHSKNIS